MQISIVQSKQAGAIRKVQSLIYKRASAGLISRCLILSMSTEETEVIRSLAPPEKINPANQWFLWNVAHPEREVSEKCAWPAGKGLLLRAIVETRSKQAEGGKKVQN